MSIYLDVVLVLSYGLRRLEGGRRFHVVGSILAILVWGAYMSECGRLEAITCTVHLNFCLVGLIAGSSLYGS